MRLTITAPLPCVWCGAPYPTHNLGCPTTEYGRYEFTPHQLTEDDIRRIVREELERAKDPGP